MNALLCAERRLRKGPRTENPGFHSRHSRSKRRIDLVNNTEKPHVVKNMKRLTPFNQYGEWLIDWPLNSIKARLILEAFG